MDNNDTTLKLLPIDSLQEILFNESTFLNFYNQNNQDYIEDRDSYLKGINDLMVVLMKYDDSLTEEVFHRINAINKKFSVGLIYDYSRYQYKTESLINLNVLRSIIYNDDVYNKFLDFNNNKEFFGNIPLIDYLVSLNNYYDSLKNTHLEIPPGVQSRFAEISRQYTFDNQRANILNGQFIEADLPKSIEKEILSKIDLSDDKFTIARNIYTELNKKCCFDLTFQALHQSMDNPVSKEIYEKDVASVKKGKIIVVCRTWAITYANLLKKCGIDAVIAGSFHKLVQFEADGILMKADATEIYKSPDGIYLNDITRCQLNMNTVGFVPMESGKDITSDILNADYKLNHRVKQKEDFIRNLSSEYSAKFMKKSNKFDDFISRFKKTEEKRPPIYDKINLLSNSIKNSSLVDMELIAYAIMLYGCIFSKEEKQCLFYNYICFQNNNKFHTAGLLFSLNVGDRFEHLIIDKKHGVRQVNDMNLLEQIKNGKIVFLGKNKNVMGLQEDMNNGLTK